MINNYGCTPDDGKTCNAVPAPGPAPIASMLVEADNITEKVLAMVMQINNQVFGKGPKERKGNDPRCMRDALAGHVDNLKAVCEELNDICQGLGV